MIFFRRYMFGLIFFQNIVDLLPFHEKYLPEIFGRK